MIKREYRSEVKLVVLSITVVHFFTIQDAAGFRTKVEIRWGILDSFVIGSWQSARGIDITKNDIRQTIPTLTARVPGLKQKTCFRHLGHIN